MTDQRAEGRLTCKGRRCVHPHTTSESPADWLAEISTDPVPTGQLALLTETGWVPYCGWDNRRGQAAAGALARRYLNERIVTDAAQWPDTLRFLADGTPVPRYEEQRFALPQMVLSHALAEAEGRFCVADGIAERMLHFRRAS